MRQIEENDPVEPTIADRDSAVEALKRFDLHNRVDVVEFVALAIKSERTRVEARQNQELAELRERYPDALFKAEDLVRQVDLLEAKVKRLVDESGFDAAFAEKAELDRDRAKAEAQRAEQDLEILKKAVQLTGEEQDMLMDEEYERFLDSFTPRIMQALTEVE